MILFKKSAVAFFFLFFLHGFSIGNGQQGISYNGFGLCARWRLELPHFQNSTEYEYNYKT